MNKKLERANYLSEEIKKLEYFLVAVIDFDERYYHGKTDVKVIMKKKVSEKISLLGSRYFGCGTHVQEIEIPNFIRNGLIKLSEQRLHELKYELSEILDYRTYG